MKKYRRKLVAWLVTTGSIWGIIACGSSGLLFAALVLGVLLVGGTPPIAKFQQTVAATDGDNEQFPGQANVWDIDTNFAIDDGGNDQFDGALELTVGATGFPSNQTYGELTFYSPTMGTAQGVKVASIWDGTSLDGLFAPVIAGLFSGILNATSDSRLQQTLDLTGAIGTVTLTWTDRINLFAGNIIISPASAYSVVVRDTAGLLLATLFSTTVSAGTTERMADLTP